MTLILQRHPTQGNSTIGELSEEGSERWCWTLEDAIREVPGQSVAQWKIAGSTAIPAGTYQVKLTPSARFHCLMPQLLDVSGFTGIRIHSGNTTADTEGCILVGTTTDGTDLFYSRAAFELVFDRLMTAELQNDPITIDVRNPV